MARRFAILTALPLLAGCAGDAVIDHAYYAPSYDLAMARYVIQDRDVETQVLGPPPGPTSATIHALLGAMNRGSTWAGKANFTLSPKDARPNYRVLVLIEPDPATTGDALCAGTARTAPAGPASTGLRLFAALCFRDSSLAEASATSASGTSPSDPGYQSTVDQMLLALFPLRPPLAAECGTLQRFPCD